jgi:hypothetical protein
MASLARGFYSSLLGPAGVAALATCLGLAFRLSVALAPTEALTARYLADDYFYYLNVAHNVAAGHGASFDGGITTTNGFQPLFLLLLAALFRLGAGKIAALHAGLVIQSFASGAAALAAYRLLARRGRAWGGALAAGLLSLSLFFALPTLTGFETASALAAVLWSLVAFERGAGPAWVGLLCGLACLARVDAAVLPGLLGAILAARGRWRDSALLLGACLIVVLPWLAWSTLQFGGPWPDSGAVKAHLRDLRTIHRSLRTALLALPRVALPAGPAEVALSWGAPAAAAAAALTSLLAARGARSWPLPAFYGVILAGAYVLLADGFEEGALVRYLYPVWAALVLLLAADRAAQRPWLVSLLLLLHLRDLHVYRRWESTAPPLLSYVGACHTLAPEALRRHAGPQDLVAAFDAGSLGYFAERPVVNLDGLMNHEIVETARRCTTEYSACLRRYLADKGVTVLAGGTGFGWTQWLPEWQGWPRLYESPPLHDGSRLVLLRVPPLASPR